LIEVSAVGASQQFEFLGFCSLFEGLKEVFASGHHLHRELAFLGALLLKPDHLFEKASLSMPKIRA